ncbi:hypothetical protein NPIL_624511 [Nephila pilipes]|uniref:Uncharacterized protein n=1 Tax=Nephila pilipes TaxID=299642 RepID=A0A8X6N9D1_NEPPI|nr:hypothetical protein NPIL_624511 [Nephila pilipes]
MCRGEIQSELFMDYVGGRRLNRCHDNALNAGIVGEFAILKKREKPALFQASFMETLPTRMSEWITNNFSNSPVCPLEWKDVYVANPIRLADNKSNKLQISVTTASSQRKEQISLRDL